MTFKKNLINLLVLKSTFLENVHFKLIHLCFWVDGNCCQSFFYISLRFSFRFLRREEKEAPKSFLGQTVFLSVCIETEIASGAVYC
jgi:hypothetical protein